MLVRTRDGIGLVLFPKAATSAVTNALPNGWSEVSPKVFEPLSQRVAFMRDPYRRAESAYRMFLAGGNSRHDMASFPAFVRCICQDDKGDPHVMSQMQLCRPTGWFLPTYIVRWDFEELSKIIGVKIPPSNQSAVKPVRWSQAARDLFTKTYAEDLALWRDKWTP